MRCCPGGPISSSWAPSLVGATFSQPKYKVNVNTLEHLAARTLGLNEIGVCTVSTDRMVPFDPYSVESRHGRVRHHRSDDQRHRGRRSSAFLAAPISKRPLAGARGRCRRPKRHDGARSGVVWFTGISGAGKSTIANRTEQLLHARACIPISWTVTTSATASITTLGFTELDRIENIRRVAEVARLMADAGLVVLASFISPFRAERRLARELAGDGRFCEVYVDTSLEVAEARDRKGLYRKARRGRADQLHRHRLALRGARIGRAGHRHLPANGRGSCRIPLGPASPDGITSLGFDRGHQMRGHHRQDGFGKVPDAFGGILGSGPRFDEYPSDTGTGVLTMPANPQSTHPKCGQPEA